mmetsp:Transcript_413/g.1038  ORF Transcript_413/g.1038 Transcript_413/m.1038 type:complete len:223 (+) Transcript_413:469-1137(+)
MAGGGHAHASLRTSAGCARSAEVCNTASATHGAFSAEASTTLRPHALEASSSLRACGCPGLVDVPLFTVLPGSSSAAEFSATLCLEVPLSRALCTGMLLSCCSESPIWEDAAPAAGCLGSGTCLRWTFQRRPGSPKSSAPELPHAAGRTCSTWLRADLRVEIAGAYCSLVSAAECEPTELCLDGHLSRDLCTGVLPSCCSESSSCEDAAPADGCRGSGRCLR